jgi:hypothetical protein
MTAGKKFREAVRRERPLRATRVIPDGVTAGLLDLPSPGSSKS